MAPVTDSVEQELQRGLALHRLGRLSDAEKIYEDILNQSPEYFHALHLLGLAAYQKKNLTRAAELIGRAIQLNPNHARSHNNLGAVRQDLRRLDEALSSYDRAIALDANYADAYFNRGSVLADLKRFDDALASYDKAIALNPNHADAYNSRGHALEHLKRPVDAIASYDKTLAIRPDYKYAMGRRLNLKFLLCDWADLDSQVAQTTEMILDGGAVSAPFVSLLVSDSARVQKKCAELYTSDKYPPQPTAPLTPRYPRHDRIRIGYFSGDFHAHAIMYLMAEMFEAFDRSQFELIAFSFGPDRNDEWRQRAIGTFDHFIDVRSESDRAVAERARRMEIDIAIDLKGFTQDCRPGIFAARAAPIQVSFLGYSATMGAPYIDYMIADKTLIPESTKAFYSEKIAFLPDSFQPNCRALRVTNSPISRRDVGIPEAAFVYCCFNNSYKITPSVFDVWMRILQQVKGSVLWLWIGLEDARDNLRREAERRGVDATRIIFAEHAAIEDHLNRLRLADLFLDTMPYNAHTTASEALRMGAPLLTCTGEAFASRVAASLLNAVGLPELITTTLTDYEARAVELGINPDRCERIRQKLATNLPTCALYDVETFTRNLESAYRAMYERHQSGLPPDNIHV